jgi:hypothetical protein
MTKTPETDPQLDSDTSDLDPGSLAAIRTLLASEDPVEPQPVAEREAAQAAAGQAPAAAPAPKRSRLGPLAPQSKNNVKRQKIVKPAKAPKPEGDSMFDVLKAKVMAYRPTPKHILLAGLALLVLFRPWLIFGLLFLFAFVVVGVILILGYDGFWHRVMGVARWYARKHPSRSAELHRKLDNFAVRFDAFLDRFPEGTVDGLYLPDFGDLAEAEARHDEALDRRFENLRETEA